MPAHIDNSQTVRLSAKTWVGFYIPTLALFGGIFLHFMAIEHRVSVLETNQQVLIKSVESNQQILMRVLEQKAQAIR
jgi:hypothetical protein